MQGSTSISSDFREFIHIRLETRRGQEDSDTFCHVFEGKFFEEIKDGDSARSGRGPAPCISRCL